MSFASGPDSSGYEKGLMGLYRYCRCRDHQERARTRQLRCRSFGGLHSPRGRLGREERGGTEDGRYQIQDWQISIRGELEGKVKPGHRVSQPPFLRWDVTDDCTVAL